MKLFHNLTSRRAAALMGITVALSLSPHILAQPAPPPPTAQYNVDSTQLALEGYDPVTYFSGGKPVKGRKDFSVRMDGISYQFASAENRDAFQKEPAKYKPAYGGWCATAMAKGQKVEVDPTNFKVTNGRLFLFFKAFYGNALKDWIKDEPTQTTKADAHWKRITHE